MPKPIILSSTPADRFDDGDELVSGPQANIAFARDQVTGEFIASALGLEARHRDRAQALADIEQKIAAHPDPQGVTLGSDFQAAR